MRTHNKGLILGAHLSISDGLDKAIMHGEEIGCTAIQFFTKSNRQWNTRPLEQEEIQKFKKTVAHSTIETNNIVVHASYLINIASPDPVIHERSISALMVELERCHLLDVSLLVIHPGSHTGSGEEAGIERIITSINFILEKFSGKTKILIETMAGQGTSIGHKLEQLALILNGITSKDRVGICLDTCHLFAAGYDFTTEKAYYNFFDYFNQVVGIQHVYTIHLNDSLKECGSHVDRHAQIGKGKIPLTLFELIINDKNFTEYLKY